MTGTTTGIEVTVPDIGDFAAVPIIEVHVAAGDKVAAEDPLLTLESDKATMDVPAPQAGTVTEVLVKVGDEVGEGSRILFLAPGDGAVTAPPSLVEQQEPRPGAAAAAPVAAAVGASLAAPPAVSTPDAGAGAGGGARRPECAADGPRAGRGPVPGDRVRAEGADHQGRPAGVPEGSGRSRPRPRRRRRRRGRGFRRSRRRTSRSSGRWRRSELSRIKKVSGPFLHRSWLNVPHVTHNDEADITELDAYRKRLDTAAKGEKNPYRVTLLAFLVKAVVAALKQHPEFNSSLTAEKDAIVLKRYYNIGIAVDTPDGLVVPVVKDADRKGIVELSQEFGAISAKARDGKLGPGDMQGGTFTISSLGGIGGTSFTPIVNAPEVAILGVVRSAMRPVWNGTEFVPRNMLPVSVSYDHRVVDGALAARFTRHLCFLLEDDRRLLL